MIPCPRLVSVGTALQRITRWLNEVKGLAAPLPVHEFNPLDHMGGENWLPQMSAVVHICTMWTHMHTHKKEINVIQNNDWISQVECLAGVQKAWGSILSSSTSKQMKTLDRCLLLVPHTPFDLQTICLNTIISVLWSKNETQAQRGLITQRRITNQKRQLWNYNWIFQFVLRHSLRWICKFIWAA